jgi:hypothetical protein
MWMPSSVEGVRLSQAAIVYSASKVLANYVAVAT